MKMSRQSQLVSKVLVIMINFKPAPLKKTFPQTARDQPTKLNDEAEPKKNSNKFFYVFFCLKNLHTHAEYDENIIAFFFVPDWSLSYASL